MKPLMGCLRGKKRQGSLPLRIPAVADGETAKMVWRARQASVRQRMCRLLDLLNVLLNDNSLIRSDCVFPG